MKKRYFKYLIKYKGQYAFLLFAYACVVISQLRIPQIVSRLIVKVGEEKGEGIAALVGILLFFIVTEAIGTYCFGHLNYKLSNRLLVDAEHDILQRVLRIQYEKIAGINSVYLSQQTNNDLALIMDFYVEKVPLLLFQLIKSIVIVVMLFNARFFVGFFALLGIIVYVVLYCVTRRKYYKLNREHSNAKAVFVSVISGKISRILLIKLNSWYETIKKEFKEVGDKFVEIAVRYLDFDNLTSNISNVISRILLLAVLLVFYLENTGGSEAAKFAGFTVALLYMQELLPCIKYVIQGGNFYQMFQVSCDRMEKLYEFPLEKCGMREVNRRIDEIRAENISFSYGEKSVLKNFSHKFEQGKLYAVCGENGAGKSTLFLLVAGILEPAEGKIFWNGDNFLEIDAELLRRDRVSFVNQEPLLVEDTIYNNLFYGFEGEKKEISELGQYPLLDFVKEQPDGYETRIDSRSGNLSGGQKQRIAIMRAVLKDADVLFLDEPTSALDTEGVSLFIEMMRTIKQNRIIFLISHDTRVLDICDETIELRKE